MDCIAWGVSCNDAMMQLQASGQVAREGKTVQSAPRARFGNAVAERQNGKPAKYPDKTQSRMKRKK
jgi:hypothetical protein